MPTFYETKNYRAIIDGKQTNEDINEGQKLKLYVVNDLLSSVKYTINIDWMDFSGKVMKNWGNIEHTSEYDTVDVVWEIDPRLFNDKRKDGFFRCVLTTDNGETKTNYYFPTVYKNCDLQLAKIDVDVKNGPEGTTIALTSDKPAFFVFLEVNQLIKSFFYFTVDIDNKAITVNSLL